MNSLWVKLSSKKIGEDQFGNEYFIGKNTNYLGQPKRFVIYKGKNESSKVPPMWHGWLHYLDEEVPLDSTKSRYDWQCEHVPNLTGTKHAYNPAESKCTKGDVYSRWIPK